jgi:hypothetical protein
MVSPVIGNNSEQISHLKELIACAEAGRRHPLGRHYVIEIGQGHVFDSHIGALTDVKDIE